MCGRLSVSRAWIVSLFGIRFFCEVENQILVAFGDDAESAGQKVPQILLPGKILKVSHDEILRRPFLCESFEVFLDVQRL